MVEFFDGEKWEELESKFPAVIYGASAISFGGKLWVIGGSSFNKYQAGGPLHLALRDDATLVLGRFWELALSEGC